MSEATLTRDEVVGQGGRGQLRRVTYTFLAGASQTYDLFDVRANGQGSAGVVPLDDAGNVYLVREFLPALGVFGLSIPRGGIEPGETALVAAQRELQEEAGLACTDLQPLWQGTVIPNASSWQASLFLGRGIQQVPRGGGDEVGGVSTIALPLAEACKQVMRGEIPGALTGLALLMAQQKVNAR